MAILRSIAETYIDKAIQGLSDPEFNSGEQLNEYAQRIRESFGTMQVTGEERIVLLRKFQTALYEVLMDLGPKKHR